MLDLLLEKWPLGNSAEANRASQRPGFLARGPGKSNVTSDALLVPAAYAIHGEDRGTLALAAVAEDPPTTAAGELET